MYLYHALRIGLKYADAMCMPLSLLCDLIATQQLLEQDYRRVLHGDDAEDEFRSMMRLR